MSRQKLPQESAQCDRARNREVLEKKLTQRNERLAVLRPIPVGFWERIDRHLKGDVAAKQGFHADCARFRHYYLVDCRRKTRAARAKLREEHAAIARLYGELSRRQRKLAEADLHMLVEVKYPRDPLTGELVKYTPRGDEFDEFDQRLEDEIVMQALGLAEESHAHAEWFRASSQLRGQPGRGRAWPEIRLLVRVAESGRRRGLFTPSASPDSRFVEIACVILEAVGYRSTVFSPERLVKQAVDRLRRA